MSHEIRKATIEYKVPESQAASWLALLKTKVRIGEAMNALPDDVIFYDAKILETPPEGTGYRLIQAVYEARSR